MKSLKIFFALLCLIASTTLPVEAGHLGCYTNYVANGGFADINNAGWPYNNTNWTFANGAYWEHQNDGTPLDDPCDPYFGYKLNAAALTVPNARVSQEFTTSANPALSWTMAFEIQTQSIAGATAWDELRILVEDLTNGQTEVFFVKGNHLTSTCQRFDFTLSKNYAGHRVRLSFNTQAFTHFDMYIDNVAFWGQYC